MKKIRLLDCTLRDGGYINDWKFGKDTISGIIDSLIESKIDIIEVGFLRDEEYCCDRSVFSDVSIVDEYASKIHSEKIACAAMAEISNPIPIDKIKNADENSIDIIRVIIWKTKRTPDGKVVDALKESYDYCKEIVKKGYKLCVQPNRTDQYSYEEFRNLVKMFAELSPMAIYVVDSWGTMYSNKIIKYMKIADEVLPPEIAIGFHAHNNMMQAFSTAEKIAESGFQREIIIDASIDGIGRGAGNLNLELIARYLNEEHGYSYNLDPMYEIYDKYISELKKKYLWGYTLPFFMSASYNANPNYAQAWDKQLSLSEMKIAYETIDETDAVIYSDAKAEEYKNEIKGYGVNQKMSPELRELRKDILYLSNVCQDGNLQSAFSCIDVIWILYSEFMNWSAEDPLNDERDIFIISKGQATLALYPVLAKKGLFTVEEIASDIGKFDSRFSNQVDVTKFSGGIENSAGSLGHGLPFAVGIAMANKIRNIDSTVYVLCGDGEFTEGTMWESCILASAHKLDNLCVIIDDNNSVQAMVDMESMKNKLEAFGFDVYETDGHNTEAIRKAFGYKRNHKPVAVIAHTVRGYGSKTLMENDIWFHKAPNDEELLVLQSEVDMF